MSNYRSLKSTYIFQISIIDHDVSLILRVPAAQYQPKYSVAPPYDGESPYNFWTQYHWSWC